MVKNNKENQFEISDGNLKVLEMIPIMMKNEKYRKELRRLCLNFLSENTLKRNENKWIKFT